VAALASGALVFGARDASACHPVWYGTGYYHTSGYAAGYSYPVSYTYQPAFTYPATYTYQPTYIAPVTYTYQPTYTYPVTYTYTYPTHHIYQTGLRWGTRRWFW
jgi:hypothetical protein